MARFDKSNNDDAPKRQKPAPKAPTRLTEPRCKICNSQSRKSIDKYLAMGIVSMAEIARHFSAIDGENYTRQSMATHRKNHLSLREAAHRRLLERKAEEEGMDVDEVVGSILTERSILETMINKGYEDIVNDRVQIAPGDMLAALTKLKNAEIELYQAKVKHLEREMTEEMEALVSSMQKHIPDALFKRVLGDFKVTLEEIRKQQTLEIESGSDAN